MHSKNKNKTYIIAEAGVNHNGSLQLAKKLVDEAISAGVDAIKFQTFKAQNLVTKRASKADYQKNNIVETQYEMLKKIELSYDDFKELNDYCRQKGIYFMSTAFDLESIDFLESLGVGIHKIPSGEITNYPYIKKLAQSGKEIILSTGMSNMDEIKEAVNLIKSVNTAKLSVLHCTTEYPAPYNEVNLNVISSLKNELKLPIGYSDHTAGIEVCIAAAAMGATILEKHFTLDKNMEGPDHKASLDPNELKQLVTSVRNIEKALGSNEKIATESEEKNKKVARKSIVAAKEIKKGELLTEENLTVKRPGIGINPMKWLNIIGTKAVKDFSEDDLIIIEEKL